jgi:PAS domain S-box-containing protein
VSVADARNGATSQESREVVSELRRALAQIAALEQLLDVHEQSSLEQAMRLERALLERDAILGQIADVVVTTDASGNLTFYNEAARALYGDITTGIPIWDARQSFELLDVAGERKQPQHVPLYRALREERVTNEEWRIRRKDGSELIVMGSAVPLRSSGDSLIGAAMSVRDVTQQRTLQRQVEHERARLQEVLMQAPAAITVTEGPEHVIVMQNEAARGLLGGRSAVGMRSRDILPSIEAQGFIALQDTVFRTGEPFVGQEVPVRLNPTSDGGVADVSYFNFVYQPLRDLAGTVYGILSHAVDVTDQVRARQAVEDKVEELARLSAELERSNKELDQFAYVASHDLKAPLRGIANLTQWIEEDLGDKVTGESREHMALLTGRVHRMEALIDGILSYSRAGRVRDAVTMVDVGALLVETIELLAPDPPASITLVPPMPVFVTERVPLQQVFINLIGNALKYADRPDAHVEIAAETRGEFVRFAVSDNGPGIAPQFQDRIWQIFQTLAPRDKVEGTGIGLSVVRKLVETRGGHAWLDSTPGNGSTFYFTWPVRPRTDT